MERLSALERQERQENHKQGDAQDFDAKVGMGPMWLHQHAAGGQPVQMRASARFEQVRQAYRSSGGLPVQRKAAQQSPQSTGGVYEAAKRGVQGSGQGLPYLEQVQASFGHHDVSGVRAHVGGAAAQASQDIGAEAYATGNDVAFGQQPSLHTAAHEAAHVVQQRAGVHLKGGVGQAGDPYEQHADAVADLVVQGKSAQKLLDEGPGAGGALGGESVQRKEAGSEGQSGEQGEAQEKEEGGEESEAPQSISLTVKGTMDRESVKLVRVEGEEAKSGAPVSYEVESKPAWMDIGEKGKASIRFAEGSDKYEDGTLKFSFAKDTKTFVKLTGAEELKAARIEGSGSKGTLAVDPPKSIEMDVGSFGKLKIQDIGVDKGGLTFKGVYTPKNLAPLEETVPGAKVEETTVVMSRAKGEWESQGKATLSMKAGKKDLATLSFENVEVGDELKASLSGELFFGSGKKNRVKAAGSFDAKEKHVELSAKVGHDIIKPSGEEGGGNTKFALSGDCVAKYTNEKAPYWSVEGVFNTGLTFPNGAEVKGKAGVEMSQGTGFAVIGGLEGEFPFGQVIPGQNKGEKKRSVSFGAVAKYIPSKNAGERLQVTEGKLKVELSPTISAEALASYDGKAWSVEGKVEGKGQKIPGFEDTKRFPEEPLSIKSPTAPLPLGASGLMLSLGFEAEAQAYIKPVTVDWVIEGGLDLNNPDKLVDSLRVEGTSKVEAGAEVGGSVILGLDANLILGKAGAALKGTLGANTKVNGSLKGSADLIGGENFNIMELQSSMDPLGPSLNAEAQLSLDNTIEFSGALLLRASSLFGGLEAVYEYPILEPIELLKYGPIGVKYGMHWSESNGADTGFLESPQFPTEVGAPMLGKLTAIAQSFMNKSDEEVVQYRSDDGCIGNHEMDDGPSPQADPAHAFDEGRVLDFGPGDLEDRSGGFNPQDLKDSE